MSGFGFCQLTWTVEGINLKFFASISLTIELLDSVKWCFQGYSSGLPVVVASALSKVPSSKTVDKQLHF
jgi:hypothetical protein